MPKRFNAQELSDASRGARWLGLLGRVKDDVDPSHAANAEVRRISRAMEKQFPEQFASVERDAARVQDYIVGDMRKPLFIMLGAVALVLLIAVRQRREPAARARDGARKRDGDSHRARRRPRRGSCAS